MRERRRSDSGRASLGKIMEASIFSICVAFRSWTFPSTPNTVRRGRHDVARRHRRGWRQGAPASFSSLSSLLVLCSHWSFTRPCAGAGQLLHQRILRGSGGVHRRLGGPIRRPGSQWADVDLHPPHGQQGALRMGCLWVLMRCPPYESPISPTTHIPPSRSLLSFHSEIPPFNFPRSVVIHRFLAVLWFLDSDNPPFNRPRCVVNYGFRMDSQGLSHTPGAGDQVAALWDEVVSHSRGMVYPGAHRVWGEYTLYETLYESLNSSFSSSVSFITHMVSFITHMVYPGARRVWGEYTVPVQVYVGLAFSRIGNEFTLSKLHLRLSLSTAHWVDHSVSYLTSSLPSAVLVCAQNWLPRENGLLRRVQEVCWCLSVFVHGRSSLSASTRTTAASPTSASE